MVWFELSALSDDAQAVVAKRMEAPGNEVVAGEAPHAYDFLSPLGRGPGKSVGLFKAPLPEGIDALKGGMFGEEPCEALPLRPPSDHVACGGCPARHGSSRGR